MDLEKSQAVLNFLNEKFTCQQKCLKKIVLFSFIYDALLFAFEEENDDLILQRLNKLNKRYQIKKKPFI